MMHLATFMFALLCSSLSLTASAEPKAQLVSTDSDVLLKLDYATYRGYYNSTNEVKLPP